MGRDVAPTRSARRDELLERAYDHVLAHGIAAMSLRPLAREIGSSPRVLLYLFGSKDGLVRALLARARADELVQLRALEPGDQPRALETVVAELWDWLAAPEHGGLLRLWVEAYGRSLVEPTGPWSGFARATVEDWLELLDTASGGTAAQRTLALALLRGAFLDLLATGDARRTGAAVALALDYFTVNEAL